MLKTSRTPPLQNRDAPDSQSSIGPGIAVFLGLLVIVLALVEARLGQGEPQCGFSPSLGGRHNVFWCGPSK